MERVIKWLDDPNYNSGVQLYDELGKNDFLKKIFNQGETDYSRKKLFEELSAMAGDYQPQNIPIESKDNSYLLKKLRHDRQQVYRQIDANMFALRKARNESSRKEHAFQILRLQRRKQEILDNIDHLEEYGTLPPKQTKKDFITPEIQRLYVQIWKTRKRLERTDLRDRDRTQKLLDEKLKHLEELRKEADYV